MDQTILQHLRLRAPVADALARMAEAAGQELADYLASVLGEHALPSIVDEEVRTQIRAEAAVKRAAADMARRFSPPGGPFRADITLEVFRALRTNPDLAKLYREAIGGGTGFERNNTAKARLNRAIGGICKQASGGSSKGPDGEVTMVQVSGEFCFSYTRLHPPG